MQSEQGKEQGKEQDFSAVIAGDRRSKLLWVETS